MLFPASPMHASTAPMVELLFEVGLRGGVRASLLWDVRSAAMTKVSPILGDGEKESLQVSRNIVSLVQNERIFSPNSIDVQLVRSFRDIK